MATRRVVGAIARVPATMAAAAAHRHWAAGRLLCGHNSAFAPAASSSVFKAPYASSQPLRFSTVAFKRFWFSSSASPDDNKDQNQDATKTANDSSTPGEETDTELDLSKDDLVKLVAEKEELLSSKDEEIKQMKEKVLRSYAEMENVITRTRRESENSQKFAVQGFAKNLLDVADNLSRASSVVKESFSKIDVSNDTAGAVPLVRTLLQGVEMTEKQLTDVFKKFGVEKFDPLNEKFDPNRHYALFPVSDPSKPSGTVVAVLKAGYMLHDRVLRPAEVGVTEGAAEETTENSDEQSKE